MVNSPIAAGTTLRRSAALPSAGVIAVGLAGATSLLAFYLGLVTLAQDWNHAASQLRTDLWFVAPISVGFSVQVGLLAYLRGLQQATAPNVAVAAGSIGVNGSAMLACCAHHLTDLLPLVGASGFAIFLNDIKAPLALAGIAFTWGAVAYMARKILRLGRQGSAAICPAPEIASVR